MNTTERKLAAAGTFGEAMNIIKRGCRAVELRHSNASCYSNKTIEGRKLNAIACKMADSAAANARGDIEEAARLFVEAQSGKFAASIV